MNDNPWTDAAIAKLRVLHAEGVPCGEIAHRLGRSKGAVIGKAHRLDLPKRPNPIGVTGPKSNPSRIPRMPRIPKPPRTLPKAPRVVVPLSTPVAPLPAPGACLYPLWGALHPDDSPVLTRLHRDPPPGMTPRFCDAPAAGRYCKRHHALCFRPVREAA